MESSALCKSPRHRGRRNAQPLRCSLASLPLSLALPVFHSSSSSSVAHSSSIKPAPLVRLLLDIPEVKHLQPRVTSATTSPYLSLRLFHYPSQPLNAHQLQLPRLSAAGLYPYLAASCTRLFPDSYDNRTPHATSHLPDHHYRVTLETSFSITATKYSTTPIKSPCLLSEASQQLSRSRPSYLTKRTRRGMCRRRISTVCIDTNTSQSLYRSVSPQ